MDVKPEWQWFSQTHIRFPQSIKEPGVQAHLLLQHRNYPKVVCKQLCPEIYSPNLLCWVESAMCADSATVRPGVIPDRIKTLTEARKKELMLKAVSRGSSSCYHCCKGKKHQWWLNLTHTLKKENKSPNLTFCQHFITRKGKSKGMEYFSSYDFLHLEKEMVSENPLSRFSLFTLRLYHRPCLENGK